jgi:hypothetical protein
MDIDSLTWAVHRHVIDAHLDELDMHVPTTDLFRSPIRAIRLPRELLGLDTQALEEVARNAMTLLASNEVGRRV